MKKEEAFKERLKAKNYGSEELRKLAKKAEIHPLMPTKYSPQERAELREFEKKLLQGIELDI